MARLAYLGILLPTVLSTIKLNYGSAALSQDSAYLRPEEHLCPITCEVMKDPVVASDGRSYEQAAIQKWIRTHGISPITRERLSNDLHSNRSLLSLIREWKPEAQTKQTMLVEKTQEELVKAVRDEFIKNNELLEPEHTARGKDIVVFLGNTGAGKSTLINFLAGKPLKIVGQLYALQNSRDPEAMPIGNRMFNSETLYTKSIDIETEKNGKLRLFDFPGFNDTDGSVRNLVQAAFVRQILLEARTVRFVYVAGQDQFTADRGQSVQQIISSLSNLFVTTSDSSGPLDRGLFVVNKEDGLIAELGDIKNVNLPEQIKIWRDQESIERMYHARLCELNTQDHQEQLISRIANLEPQQLISINMSGLYPANTRNDIERMYQGMYEEAYRNAEGVPCKTLTEVSKKLKLWEKETFWDEFESIYIFYQNPAIKVLTDFTFAAYNKVRRRYFEEQEKQRSQYIEYLRDTKKGIIEKLRKETNVRIRNIVRNTQTEQVQKGGAPYDFSSQEKYWNLVCGAEVLQQLTTDSEEQEVIRSAYIRWIGERFQEQIKRQRENNEHIRGLQQQINELSREVQSLQKGIDNRASNMDATSRTRDVLGARPKLKASRIAIPEIAIGHEEIYQRFLMGRLMYKPDPFSDVGQKEFRIGSLTNPLSGVFDISGCGDSAQYLQISTGYRTTVNSVNVNKVEVWILPQFLIQRDPRARKFNDSLQILEEHRDKPFAILFTWGGWKDLTCYEVVGDSGGDFDTFCDAWDNAVATQNDKDLSIELQMTGRGAWEYLERFSAIMSV